MSISSQPTFREELDVEEQPQRKLWQFNETECGILLGNLRDPVTQVACLAIIRVLVSVTILQLWKYSGLSSGHITAGLTMQKEPIPPAFSNKASTYYAVIFIIYLICIILFQLTSCYGLLQVNRKAMFFSLVTESIIIGTSIYYSIMGIKILMIVKRSYMNVSQVATVVGTCLLDLLVFQMLCCKLKSIGRITPEANTTN